MVDDISWIYNGMMKVQTNLQQMYNKPETLAALKGVDKLFLVLKQANEWSEFTSS